MNRYSGIITQYNNLARYDLVTLRTNINTVLILILGNDGYNNAILYNTDTIHAT